MYRRILSIVLLFLMLHVALQPVLSMHYCKNQLHSVSFFGRASTCCGMKELVNPSIANKFNNSNEIPTLSKANCCKNRSVDLTPIQIQVADVNIATPQLLVVPLFLTPARFLSEITVLRWSPQDHGPPEALVIQNQYFHALICQYLI